jgi:signal peptidase I
MENKIVENENSNNKSNLLKEIRDYGISILIAIAVALLCNAFIFARADVDGESMLPTLHDKDVVFVEKITNLTKHFKRGQIIIFDRNNAEKDILVKRVIGIEGDQIQIKEGKVYVNGEALKEDYLKDGTFTAPSEFLANNKTYTVEKNHVFVLGDNRENSVDSRILGTISIKDIKGHTVIRLYPFNSIRLF